MQWIVAKGNTGPVLRGLFFKRKQKSRLLCVISQFLNMGHTFYIFSPKISLSWLGILFSC